MQLIMSGCAVGPDGTLLDAANIVFYHDANDDTQISAPHASALCSDLGHLIHKIVGSHHPQCTLCPLTKAWDPNNTVSIKCKMADKPLVCRVAQKFTVSSNSDKENDNLLVVDAVNNPSLVDDDGADTEVVNGADDADMQVVNDTDIENAHEAYLVTKKVWVM